MGEVDEAGRYFRLAVMPQRKYTISAIERYPGTLVVLLPASGDFRPSNHIMFSRIPFNRVDWPTSSFLIGTLFLSLTAVPAYIWFFGID
jgi:hypothetical protein